MDFWVVDPDVRVYFSVRYRRFFDRFHAFFMIGPFEDFPQFFVYSLSNFTKNTFYLLVLHFLFFSIKYLLFYKKYRILSYYYGWSFLEQIYLIRLTIWLVLKTPSFESVGSFRIQKMVFLMISRMDRLRKNRVMRSTECQYSFLFQYYLNFANLDYYGKLFGSFEAKTTILEYPLFEYLYHLFWQERT